MLDAGTLGRQLAHRSDVVHLLAVETRALRKRKRPAGSMQWGAYETAADAAGTWLYTPQGSTVSGKSTGGEPAWSYVGVPEEPGLHVLQLVPRSGWWIAHVKVHPVNGRLASGADPNEVNDSLWSRLDAVVALDLPPIHHH